MIKTKMTVRIDSDLRQLLTYIVNGETDRLKQYEWKEIAKKKLDNDKTFADDWEKKWDKIFASKLKGTAWTAGEDKATYNQFAKDFIKSLLWGKNIEIRNIELRLKESDTLKKLVKSDKCLIWQ